MLQILVSSIIGLMMMIAIDYGIILRRNSPGADCHWLFRHLQSEHQEMNIYFCICVKHSENDNLLGFFSLLSLQKLHLIGIVKKTNFFIERNNEAEIQKIWKKGKS